MSDWIEQAAHGIRNHWRQWEQEAGEIAQGAQDHEAGERHLQACLTNYLRWVYANHSKRKEMTP